MRSPFKKGQQIWVNAPAILARNGPVAAIVLRAGKYACTITPDNKTPETLAELLQYGCGEMITNTALSAR